MLKLNIKRLCTLYGITKPVGYLTKYGFASLTASNIIRGKIVGIKPAQIEKLCVAFHCTPNDLFEWIPGEKQKEITSHPLNTLIRQEAKSLHDAIKGMCPEEISELINHAREMKSSG